MRILFSSLIWNSKDKVEMRTKNGGLNKLDIDPSPWKFFLDERPCSVGGTFVLHFIFHITMDSKVNNNIKRLP